MNIPSSIVTLLLGIGLTLISLWYGSNHGLMPLAVSEEATHIDSLFNAMMTIATGLFIIVQGVLIVAAFKFRRKAGDTTDGEHIEGNVPLEILWTAIPAVIVIWLSFYSFEIYNEMGGFDPNAANDPHSMHMASHHHSAIAATMDDKTAKRPQIALGVGASPNNQDKVPDVVVNVMGLQYAWIFNYPETSITSGELHIPIHSEVQLNITATDVIHAVWIPELRLKQDAIPGTPTQIRFTANKTGTYPVRCAELCGGYHGSMVTTMVVHSSEDYIAWVQSQQQVAQTNDLENALAMNPQNMTEGEYLAPYAQEMGVNAQMLHQLHN